jgi:hypothetical protein
MLQWLVHVAWLNVRAVWLWLSHAFAYETGSELRAVDRMVGNGIAEHGGLQEQA